MEHKSRFQLKFQSFGISLDLLLPMHVPIIRLDLSKHSCVMALSCLILFPNLSQATPTGGDVVSGAGNITQSAATTTVTQATQNLSVNWKSFNVAPQEVVNFVQPSTSSIAVNRILDTNGSQILGNINANGQVFLINPNGILFGQGAQVNVRGLVASALDFNDDHLNGNAKMFSGNGTGSIINQGNLTAANGGYVALLGKTVSNKGVINASQGSVMLGAGNNLTLSFENNNLLKMQVNQSLFDTLAENGGLIQTPGGQVIMNAGAKNTLQASAVNNTGVIEAHTLDSQTGKIILLSGMVVGTTNVDGSLDASAPGGGEGGFIDTSAAHVKIADGVKVSTLSTDGNTGTWLIDPADFNIGNAADGAVANISGGALASALTSADVLILSSNGTAGGSGDINGNEAVSWRAKKLTLTAANDININAGMTASGDASLALNTATTNTSTANGGVGESAVAGTEDASVAGGQVKVGMDVDGFRGRVDFANSGTDILTINGAAYDVLNTEAQLQAMAVTTNFALGANLDFTNECVGTCPSVATFTPIASFAHNFNGLGHTVTGVNIAGADAANTGMIKVAGAGSDIRNVGLVNGVVSAGGAGTGFLIGSGTSGTLSHVYSSGTVTGAAGTGGLVGSMTTGKILNSFTTGAVTGAAGTGGLVGTITTGLVDKSYSTGVIVGAAGTGGLIGASTGLVNESYASGSVQGNDGTGGLIGTTTSHTTNSYATGNVTGATGVGGLLGTNTGNVTNNYASGTVAGNVSVGGLIGTTPAPSLTAGILTNNFWNSGNKDHAIGDSTTPSGTLGITKEQLIGSGFPTRTEDSGSGSIWDFDSTWLLVDGISPMLRSTLPTLVVTANVQTNIYSGEAYTVANSDLQYSVALNSGDLTYLNGLALTNTGTSNAAVHVGTYSIEARYAGQTRYNISYVDGDLAIIARALTATAAATKEYDGNNTASSALTLVGLIDDEALTTSGVTSTFNDKNVLDANTVTVTAATLGNGTDGLASNYSLAIGDITSASATITARALTSAAVTDNSKVYDGDIDATVTLVLGGLIGTETLSTKNVTATFANKNVAKDIVVTTSGATLVDGTGLASNYSLVNDAISTTTAEITPFALTVSGLSAQSKVYNADTEAELTGTASVSANVFSGDVVGVAGTATGTFTDKNVANNIGVTVTGNTLTGAQAGNYSITQQAGLAADIFPFPVVPASAVDTPVQYIDLEAVEGTTLVTNKVSIQAAANNQVYDTESFRTNNTKTSVGFSKGYIGRTALMGTDTTAASTTQGIEQTYATNESYNVMRSRAHTVAFSSTATQGNGTATAIDKVYDSMRSRTLQLQVPLAQLRSLAPTATPNQNSAQTTTNDKVYDGISNRTSNSASKDTDTNIGTVSKTTTTATQAGAQTTEVTNAYDGMRGRNAA